MNQVKMGVILVSFLGRTSCFLTRASAPIYLERNKIRGLVAFYRLSSIKGKAIRIYLNHS